jgi:hypothetical protein
MFFWIRKFALGGILLVIAYLLLANQDFLLSIVHYVKNIEETTVQEQVIESDDSVTVKPSANASAPKKVEEVKSKNAAAEGLSRFYANINPSFDKNEPRMKNGIVYINKPQGDLTEILSARKKVINPLPRNWKGETQRRSFVLGNTLFQKLSEHVEAEGLELMWRLELDFLVKDPFRIEKNIVKTAYQVGKAIEGHFPEGVDIYFCHQHRTIILINEPNDYLSTECSLLGPKSNVW